MRFCNYTGFCLSNPQLGHTPGLRCCIDSKPLKYSTEKKSLPIGQYRRCVTRLEQTCQPKKMEMSVTFVIAWASERSD